jgi:precorrin-6B C5,15-methyltransferase / cobalt-precorrin-6B C5,C15-methyltransferase
MKWLSVVGIGESGVAGLSPIAQSLINQATLFFGGTRHLAMLSPADERQRIAWKSPLSTSIDEILAYRGQAVCVLASGDPLWYGIGTTLTQHIPLAEMTILPAPSTLSLTCAKLGWTLPEVETLSLCGRPPTLLHAVLYPGAKVLVLSEGKHTPAVVADLLTQSGYGQSLMTVLEHLGGSKERLIFGKANVWNATELADLTAIALDCIADVSILAQSRFPGLPDSAYHHDGQITKREVRAITLSTLAPTPGSLLWDVGAGCGSIAIEWMRSHPRCRAIAIEKSRTAYIADNAAALGTPNLQIIQGTAPQALQGLPQPDAIFVGGGVTTPGLLDACWSALKPGGRLVANVVTLEGEHLLFQWAQKIGGDFARIGIQRAEPIGKFLGWRSLAVVTQWVVTKP